MWDVGTASLTNEILFIRATNGRPYVILSFCRPSVNCVDSSLQGEPKKPLLEERWHEVTEWWQKGRRGAVPYEVNAIFGRPMIAPTNCIFFCISHTYNRLPLRGADGGAV